MSGTANRKVAVIRVVRPFPVGAGIGDARLDLDDGERAVAAEGDDVGAAAARQGELDEADMTELEEEPAHAALQARRDEGLAAVDGSVGMGPDRT